MDTGSCGNTDGRGSADRYQSPPQQYFGSAYYFGAVPQHAQPSAANLAYARSCFPHPVHYHSEQVTGSSLQCQGPNPKHYNYVVRFINPQRKSDYKVRKWHDMNERFTSPEGLKEKLVDTFSEHVPETMEFDMGYYTKPGSQKRWIENSKDLEAMYNSNCNDDITLWCDGRIESGSAQVPKRKSSGDTKDEPLSKRAKKEEEIETTYRSLRAKHGEEFSDPQLRLWARMQVNGLHADLENPPNVPAITGQPVKRKRDEKSHPLTEAIAGAATAITKVLVSSQRPSTPPSISMSKSTGISPASKANLSGQYLEQLRTLQQLRENGALTEEEFCAQKQLLLHNLSGLNT